MSKEPCLVLVQLCTAGASAARAATVAPTPSSSSSAEMERGSIRRFIDDLQLCKTLCVTRILPKSASDTVVPLIGRPVDSSQWARGWELDFGPTVSQRPSSYGSLGSVSGAKPRAEGIESLDRSSASRPARRRGSVANNGKDVP